MPDEPENPALRTLAPTLRDIHWFNAHLVKAAQRDPRYNFDPEGGRVFEAKLDAIDANFPVSQPLLVQMAYLFRALVWAQAFPYANKRTAVSALVMFAVKAGLRLRENAPVMAEKMAVFLHKRFDRTRWMPGSMTTSSFSTAGYR